MLTCHDSRTCRFLGAVAGHAKRGHLSNPNLSYGLPALSCHVPLERSDGGGPPGDHLTTPRKNLFPNASSGDQLSICLIASAPQCDHQARKQPCDLLPSPNKSVQRAMTTLSAPVSEA